jgi:hypothetical protein
MAMLSTYNNKTVASHPFSWEIKQQLRNLQEIGVFYAFVARFNW